VLVSSYITPKARKGVASGIEGRGLEALAPIGAGEIVAIKGGHIVTTAASTAATSLPTSCADCPASQTTGATWGESFS
jgi:hypothetical protein